MSCVDSLREKYASFVQVCASNLQYKLTPLADSSAYARCFAVFGRHLLQLPFQDPSAIAAALREDIRIFRRRSSEFPTDKSYRQLLAFTLSALTAIGELASDPLVDLVAEQIPKDVGKALHESGCLEGRAGSGNQAMFIAVFLLHARDVLGLNTNTCVEEWVDLHLRHMNPIGFWGRGGSPTYLQFQNGYHQHEILEYLGVENPKEDAMIRAVSSLADREGRFAPYPGGGGCYDYDAVFLLTPGGRIPDDFTRELLQRTADSIVSAQNPDGGFCESHYVRPRSPANLARFARHIVSAWRQPAAMKERLRYGLTLQRPKHDRIHTHWSRYSRRWNESDLWDSWFRMLALARIEAAMDPSKASEWGFIGYPGIGFHPSLRAVTAGN